MNVRPKKHLGQHFLKDNNIAINIVNALHPENSFKKVLEIGPGTGVLTKHLLQKNEYETTVIDIDTESIAFLEQNFPQLKNRIISGDFLKLPLNELFSEPFAVIGNFPYNISSQILFKVLEHRDQVPEVVGMFQKEVAERIAAPHGNKTYGILSVLVQAFYDVEYLFTVHEHVFDPPPKVKSAVIRLNRKKEEINCDEKLFFRVVKTAFNQRRKTLRNALKPITSEKNIIGEIPFLDKRAEQLSVQDLIFLAKKFE
jgi:16S rRNA (adenine1518-N6/adenine1519-N6)-dimethyltransferase